MLDALGWLATAVFSCSYFCRGSQTLRWIQAGAALIWIVYGLLLHATPVIAANVIVAVAALGSSVAGRSQRRKAVPESATAPRRLPEAG
jgi:hypothetical protein